jgi:hypothetical protein
MIKSLIQGPVNILLTFDRITFEQTEILMAKLFPAQKC